MRAVQLIVGAFSVVLGMGTCFAADPVVANVRAEQRKGKPYVDITYDLADADTENLKVSVAVSTNGGAAYFTPVAGMSGDVGSSVARGDGKKVVWNAGETLPQKLFSNVRARVTADDVAGMVLIPAGTNSGTHLDYPYESYSLTVDTFYIDRTEVTKAQWDEVRAWAATHGYTDLPAGAGKAATHPVQGVSWFDCVKWCNARSEKEGRVPCYTVNGNVCKTGENSPSQNTAVNGCRLPTCTEWEYASRGGLSSRRFPWGYTVDHSQANYYVDWRDDARRNYDLGYYGYDTRYATGGLPYTSPVGSFAVNRYGLYDMAGNVEEWCWDTLDIESHGSYRFLKGGNWRSAATYLQCYFSVVALPDVRYDCVGFRAVCR